MTEANVKSLPTKLLKPAVVEVLCEIIFDVLPGSAPATILPGIFFEKLSGIQGVQKTDFAELPEIVRRQQPTQAQVHIDVGTYKIGVADKALVVACIGDYPGWEVFKGCIESVYEILFGVGLVTGLTRCSIKYMNVLPVDDVNQQSGYLNVDMQLVNSSILNTPYNLRVELSDIQPFVHIITIASAISYQRPGQALKNGLLVDIDAICPVIAKSVERFKEEKSQFLDDLHYSAKTRYFSLLTPKALADMDPIYE